MMLALGGLVRYLTGGAATGNPVDSFRQIGRGGIEDVPVVDIIPYPLLILVVLLRRLGVADAPAVRPHPDRRRRQPRGRAATPARRCGGSRPGPSCSRRSPPPSPGSSSSATPACTPRSAPGYEFTAITAVVLGGVLLGGGRGWVLSAAAGAFALELLFTLLTFLGVASTWRDTVQGADHHRRRRRRGPRLAGRPPPARRHGPSTTPVSDQPHPTTPAPGTNTGESDAQNDQVDARARGAGRRWRVLTAAAPTTPLGRRHGRRRPPSRGGRRRASEWFVQADFDEQDAAALGDVRGRPGRRRGCSTSTAR